MKTSDLTFADLAAVEILPALVKHYSYLGENLEAEAVRYAYKLADTLAAERDLRAGVEAHIVERALRRAEAAETTVQFLRADHHNMHELWDLLGVHDQPAAADRIRALLGYNVPENRHD